MSADGYRESTTPLKRDQFTLDVQISESVLPRDRIRGHRNGPLSFQNRAAHYEIFLNRDEGLPRERDQLSGCGMAHEVRCVIEKKSRLAQIDRLVEQPNFRTLRQLERDLFAARPVEDECRG